MLKIFLPPFKCRISATMVVIGKNHLILPPLPLTAIGDGLTAALVPLAPQVPLVPPERQERHL